ncbi:MAG: XdhC family protein [Acidobacteriota bacterium]|nr:XdhC family protein [Acidobacteriota bacterium]
MESFRRLAEILRLNQSAVLATVVETKGSTPRETGAKMIVCETGKIIGTIGGGAGEAKVIETAKIVLRSGEKQAVEIDLTNLQAEGICGGRMRIWLERWQGADSLRLVNQILANLENGSTTVLITPFVQHISPYLLTENQQVTVNRFAELLEPAPVLLIVGAGHVGIELAKIAANIGFEIFVQDDRSEWANVENYPSAAEILNEPIETAINRIGEHRKLFIALLTRGFDYDVKALIAILRQEKHCVYLGMIGSERRVREVFRELEKRGASKDDLERIRAPIGLKIGALTPAEIAVSIAAELISVRRHEKENA